MGGTCPSESIALARLAPIVGTLSTGQVGPQHTETGDCQTCEHDLGVSASADLVFTKTNTAFLVLVLQHVPELIQHLFIFCIYRKKCPIY